jgi:hypothetical protein
MSAVTRSAATAVVVAALAALSRTVSVAASDSPAAVTTTVPATTTTVPATTTAVPATTAAAATAPVFPSIDAFAAAWNDTAAQLAAVDPTVEVFTIDPAAVVRGPLPPDTPLGNVEAFAVPIATNGFVGGLVDPATGAVTAVTVGGDPDAQVVRGAAGILLLSTLDVSLAGPAVEAWSMLAEDTATPRVDYVEAGQLGVTLEVIEGAESGDNLVSIVIAPVTTPEARLVTPVLTYIAVFDLALDARSAATTTTSSTAPIAQLAATTAPIARLPDSPAPTETTTTALPTVSLVPPAPTTTVAGISAGA